MDVRIYSIATLSVWKLFLQLDSQKLIDLLNIHGQVLASGRNRPYAFHPTAHRQTASAHIHISLATTDAQLDIEISALWCSLLGTFVLSRTDVFCVEFRMESNHRYGEYWERGWEGQDGKVV